MLEDVRSQARHIQRRLQPGLIDGNDEAVVIHHILLQKQVRRLGTERMPSCHIPQVVLWARFVRDKVELPTQRYRRCCCVCKNCDHTPTWRHRGGDTPRADGSARIGVRGRLQALQTPQQELRLGAYAIGEVIDTVVRQIENSPGHVTPEVMASPCYVLEHPLHRL